MRVFCSLLLALALLTPSSGVVVTPVDATSLKIAASLVSRMTADPAALQPVIVEMEHASSPFVGTPNTALAQRAVGILTAAHARVVGALPLVDAAAGWANAA